MLQSYKRTALSIDLGSTYVKLGYREPYEISARWVKCDTRPLDLDGTHFIPSTVIQAGGNYYFGTEAENLSPSENWDVYRNWKSDLYERNCGDSKVVASEFFRWLRRRLRSQHPEIDVDSADVFVSLPAFSVDLRRRGEDRILECAKSGGWSGTIRFTPEPISNALGVATNGRNHIFVHPGSTEPRPHIGEMCSGSALFRAIRARSVMAVSPGPQFQKWALLDFGSYTLDVAVLDIDAENFEEPITIASFKSIKHGAIDFFEVPLFDRIRDETGVSAQQFSLAVREKSKRQLLSNRPYVFPDNTKVEPEPALEIFSDYLRSSAHKADDALATANMACLSGGIVCAPATQGILQGFLGCNVLPVDNDDSRLATAIGGCSFWDFGTSS